MSQTTVAFLTALCKNDRACETVVKAACEHFAENAIPDYVALLQQQMEPKLEDAVHAGAVTDEFVEKMVNSFGVKLEAELKDVLEQFGAYVQRKNPSMPQIDKVHHLSEESGTATLLEEALNDASYEANDVLEEIVVDVIDRGGAVFMPLADAAKLDAAGRDIIQKDIHILADRFMAVIMNNISLFILHNAPPRG